MLDLTNRIHPEPELSGFTPRLSHGPAPVIPGTVALLDGKSPVGKPRISFAPAAELPRPAPAKPDRGPNGERLDLLRLVVRATEARPDGEYSQAKFCGTARCMAGDYVYANPGCGLEVIPIRGTIVPADSWGEPYATPANVYYTLAEHFSIDPGEAEYLFGCFGPQKKADRIARLNAFIAAKEAEVVAPDAPHEMEFDAADGYAGPVRDPSPAPADRDGGSYARALRIELNAALSRNGELATENARLRGERDELARELSRRAMARA